MTTGTADNPGDTIRDITIGYGKTGVDFNFGESRPGSIAGSVHAEFGSPDCVFNADDGDIALADVTVQLLNADGDVVSENTDERPRRI